MQFMRTFWSKVREAKQKLEKQKAETIVKLQEVLSLHHCHNYHTIIIIPVINFQLQKVTLRYLYFPNLVLHK